MKQLSGTRGLQSGVVNMLVLVFPMAAVVVEHAASGILALLTLMGIGAFFARGKQIELSRAEKNTMLVFAAYFFVTAAFMVIHGPLLHTYQPEWQLGHELRMLAFAPVFLLFLKADLKTDVFWYGITGGAIVNGLYACVFIYLQAKSRAVGAYNPIVLGDAAMALSFMSLAGLQFFENKHRALVFIPLAAAALGLTAVFLSGTRGALIAGPFLLLVFLVQLGSHPRPWITRAAVVSIAIIFVLAVYFMPGSSMNERIHSVIDTTVEIMIKQKKDFAEIDHTTRARLLMWSEAAEMMHNNPWIGAGKEGYKQTINQKAKTDPQLLKIKKYSTPHNMYLTSTVAYGIFGLAILLGLFLVPLFVLVRRIRHNIGDRDIAFAGVILILGYMQFAVTESVFDRTVPISIYLILTAAAMALSRNHREPGKQEQPG